MAKLVAVMACPTGIAHTVMAAEALEKTAKVMGHTLRAEMQGSAGAKNVLTEQEIRGADVVIIATDIYINVDRFAGKPIYAASTSDAIRKTRAVIEEALAEAEEAKAAAPVRSTDSPRAGTRSRRLKVPGGCHLMSNRHRAHLYGGRGSEQGRQSPGLRDEGRDARVGGCTEHPDL